MPRRSEQRDSVWFRFTWERAIQESDLIESTTTITVAHVLATFADGDTGENARPGEAKLAHRCRLAVSTVRKHLTLLRDLGFIEQVSRGHGFGSKAKGVEGRGSSYRLTLPGNTATEQAEYSGNTDTDVAVNDTKQRHPGSGDLENHRHVGSEPPPPGERTTATPVATTKQDHVLTSERRAHARPRDPDKLAAAAALVAAHAPGWKLAPAREALRALRRDSTIRRCPLGFVRRLIADDDLDGLLGHLERVRLTPIPPPPEAIDAGEPASEATRERFRTGWRTEAARDAS